MSKLTKDQWKWIEDNISFFSTVNIRIDGYDVSVRLSRSGNRIVYEVFVNGVWKGEWFVGNDCEEARRFYWAREIRLHSHAMKKKLIKKIGKIRASLLFDLDASFTSYHPVFYSFKTLKNSWEKNNENFEITDERYHLHTKQGNA